MSHPIAVTPAFLDQILTLLAPLFLAATNGDMGSAREAVQEALTCYGARTDNELRLAALVVGFGFGALDVLSKAANKELSLDEVMDLRDNATALSVAGDQSQAALDRLQRHPPVAAKPSALPASADDRDLVAFARSGGGLALSGRLRRASETTAIGRSRATLH